MFEHYMLTLKEHEAYNTYCALKRHFFRSNGGKAETIKLKKGKERTTWLDRAIFVANNGERVAAADLVKEAEETLTFAKGYHYDSESCSVDPTVVTRLSGLMAQELMANPDISKVALGLGTLKDLDVPISTAHDKVSELRTKLRWVTETEEANQLELLETLDRVKEFLLRVS